MFRLTMSGIVIDGFSGGRMPNRDEIMEIRINDNAFTAELTNRAEAVPKFEPVEARELSTAIPLLLPGRISGCAERVCATRPPYQTRDFTANLSGPLIRNRLTATLGLRRVTSPTKAIRYARSLRRRDQQLHHPAGWERSATLRATTQLNEEHALNFSYTTAQPAGTTRTSAVSTFPEQGIKNRERIQLPDSGNGHPDAKDQPRSPFPNRGRNGGCPSH